MSTGDNSRARIYTDIHEMMAAERKDGRDPASYSFLDAVSESELAAGWRSYARWWDDMRSEKQRTNEQGCEGQAEETSSALGAIPPAAEWPAFDADSPASWYARCKGLDWAIRDFTCDAGKGEEENAALAARCPSMSPLLFGSETIPPGFISMRNERYNCTLANSMYGALKRLSDTPARDKYMDEGCFLCEELDEVIRVLFFDGAHTMFYAIQLEHMDERRIMAILSDLPQTQPALSRALARYLRACNLLGNVARISTWSEPVEVWLGFQHARICEQKNFNTASLDGIRCGDNFAVFSLWLKRKYRNWDPAGYAAWLRDMVLEEVMPLFYEAGRMYLHAYRTFKYAESEEDEQRARILMACYLNLVSECIETRSRLIVNRIEAAEQAAEAS